MDHYRTEDGTIAYELLAAHENPSGAPTLTLLHNFMSTGRAAWGALLPLLNRRFRILLPDLPGHGASEGYPAGFDHRTIAGQLGALMYEVGAERGHLAGCSSGGMVAQRMVQHGIIVPRTLTLVSTTYSTNPHTTGVTNPVTPERFQAGRNWLQATAKLHDPQHGEDYFDTVLLPGFRNLTPATTVDMAVSDMAQVQTPICLIQGDQDEFFPPRIVQQMAEAYPNIEVHLIAGQTHALLFRAPAKVGEVMAEFLEKHTENAKSRFTTRNYESDTQP